MTVFVSLKLRVLAWNCRLPILLNNSRAVSCTVVHECQTLSHKGTQHPARSLLTRSTVGSLEDRKGPRESTDEQREAAQASIQECS